MMNQTEVLSQTCQYELFLSRKLSCTQRDTDLAFEFGILEKLTKKGLKFEKTKNFRE